MVRWEVDSDCSRKKVRAGVDSIIMCLDYNILQTWDLTDQSFGITYIWFETKWEYFHSLITWKPNRPPILWFLMLSKWSLFSVK